ncbi:hypothetical protein PsYK624_123020 [Phanerochaete sordida]|uniref:Plastocyanin-like domain-containing protein n=1 Tax=Phanerochaete sordida TaxID=48140 RepID=A0A9P3GME4_9APHY|nr:hypothetical protein PsYK624_123020 [Phanerochaete sordida]
MRAIIPFTCTDTGHGRTSFGSRSLLSLTYLNRNIGTGVGRYIRQALNATNPLRRYVFLIPVYNWMVIRFITDNPGLWALYCHLAWHMAAGLLMQINKPAKQGRGARHPAGDCCAVCCGGGRGRVRAFVRVGLRARAER